MIPYPNISPEIARIGPFAIRWYGLMYLLGFASSLMLVKYQIRKREIKLEDDFVETLYSYIIAGLLLGARIGYVIFYNAAYYLNHPLEILSVWQGGMSFHGGFIGVMLAGLLFCKIHKFDYWLIADLVVVTVPIGLGLGRLGNFINGELYGRVTNVPWAMIFPGEGMPRHPSQLYELFLEGIVLFVVLWSMKNKLRSGKLTALFLVLYGIFRIVAEFFREPDPQIGFIFGFITMGQILSCLMVAAGAMLFLARRWI